MFMSAMPRWVLEVQSDHDSWYRCNAACFLVNCKGEVKNEAVSAFQWHHANVLSGLGAMVWIGCCSLRDTDCFSSFLVIFSAHILYKCVLMHQCHVDL